MITRNKLNFNKKDCSIVNFTDITAVRQVHSLKNQNELLSLLNANLSHELNTPLNCINQMAQRLIVLLVKESPGWKLAKMVS
jgi:signal transduction histidine kinase